MDDKTIATDRRILEKEFPRIGEYLNNCLSGKPNDIFPEPNLKELISLGRVGDGSWLFRHFIRFENYVVSFELNVRINR